jgi:hypothetical protein
MNVHKRKIGGLKIFTQGCDSLVTALHLTPLKPWPQRMGDWMADNGLLELSKK